MVRCSAFGLLGALLLCAGAVARAPASVDARPPVHADPALDRVTASRLESFDSDRDFARYVERVESIRRQRQRRVGATAPPRRLAFQDAVEPPACPPDDPECAVDLSQDVVVSARSVAAPVAITNVQTGGVDEGDVVKQIGDFLLVLQDGRIFSVDTGGDRLRLVDRIDVYRSGEDDAWYDEMLVEGNRILITAYSYRERATEISVFRLDTDTGRLARDGAFLIASDDYYDSDNYATRIVGDRLIIYTPYDASEFTEAGRRPRVRRWMSAAEREAMAARGDEARGRDLIDARSIYRPLLRTLSPAVHAVTVCELGDYRADRAPPCRATAFAGPEAAEMFVAPDAVYLWVGSGWDDLSPYGYDFSYAYGAASTPTNHCPPGRTAFASTPPSVVYRLPIRGGAPSVVGLRGRPFDQFSMDESRGNFRILLGMEDGGCTRAEDDDTPDAIAYANVRLNEFGDAPKTLPARRHLAVPSIGDGAMENRFAGDWLVYGGRRYGYGAVPDPAEQNEEERARGPGRPVVVLPVADPAAAREVMLSHNAIRIERVGADRMAINGYRDDGGLLVSLLQLGPEPHVLDTARLARRFESEGRSHAFNSVIAADRSGLIGVPTVLRADDADRYFWHSEGSDVSFLTVSSEGRLGDAGPLVQGLKEPTPGYSCEVSCIDWYGNSRPIFSRGRIFALMATEIAEGRLVDGRIAEVRRVNLTAPMVR